MADPKHPDPAKQDSDTGRESARPFPNPAGPHAAPELTDNEKTPGSGVLPEPGDPNISPTS
jgi:hypothetical protein